ncbi:DUF5333 domain-containing protein [Pseudooceanicola spongiae]|jgi:hypothetical protein|uniref:DUF5333 domain-containing protein n=1 Tax=Pseudooceanicola spongiae TaxID=2613965 RepID=UPI0018673966|nr:DUF5333 domain-containing protein [Pseudooceanicola spongiae]|tara:strand:- start:98 stop:547 length:450 start_codon:yes stop_codon:yes gene_type:complete
MVSWLTYRAAPLRAAVLVLAGLSAVSVTTFASPAAARPALREVQEIDGEMLWIAMAIEISDKCDRIGARTVKGWMQLNDLRNLARDMGYSNKDVLSYVRSDAEKARIRKLGENYMKSQGLDPNNPADLCRLGDAEMARNSRIGVLLRAK